MAMKTALGIFRAARYSPGMVERDEAILQAVAAHLKAAGYAVSLIHEEELGHGMQKPDTVFHMARSPHALDILQAWEHAGCRVINPVAGVRSVEREALAKMCATHHIPTPKTWIADTRYPDRLTTGTTMGTEMPITFPCWVKRTGDCAQQPEDVCRADDAESYRRCLNQLHARGITHAVVMEHLEGPCIKFYAVQGTDFFYWLPAEKLGYDKFAAASPATGTAAAPDREVANVELPLRAIPTALKVYGGDAIIGPDGTARIIDLNDWPSFSACREQAAKAIADMIINMG